MRTTFPQRVSWIAVMQLITSSLVHAAERFKPYVLGSETEHDFAAVVKSTQSSLEAAGFELVGEYAPYADTHILIVTSPALLRAAADSNHGGFAAVQRVSIAKRNGKVQVAYTNPVYMAYAYRMKSNLKNVSDQLAEALGNQASFGAKRGLYAEDLREYHYTFGMEYFDDVYELAEYGSHQAAIDAVERNLKTNTAGVRPLYRLDIPGKQETVFGVSMKGRGEKGQYMDDQFQMGVVDHGAYSAAAYLPYEIMVTGNKVIALHMRFRMAVNFPSLRMMGSNSFMTLMPSPEAVQNALTKAVGGRVEQDEF